VPARYAADLYSVDDILFWLAIAQNPLLAAVKCSNPKAASDLTLLSKFGLTISTLPAEKRPIWISEFLEMQF